MNNFFSYLRLLLLATSGMLLLCIIFAMNPELADGTLSGKNLLVSFHISIVSRWGSTYGIPQQRKAVLSFHYRMPYYYFCSVSYWFLTTKTRIFSRNVSFSSLSWLLSGLCSEVLIQAHQELRPFFITIIIFTGIVPAIWGISHNHQSCSHHPSCLQAA